MKPITIRTIHPHGWPVEFAIEPADPKLHQIIASLQRLGYRPDVSGDTWARTPEGDPICPKHGVPMRKREKQGDIWYSHGIVDPTTGEKTYCRGYATKNGAGWTIETKTPPRPAPSRPTPSRPTPQSAPAAKAPASPDLAQLNAELYD